MDNVYLDNVSTTPVDPAVLEEVFGCMKSVYGNAGSQHAAGVFAKKILDRSRKTIAEFVNCKPAEIVFTSGGTESNNIAILGAAAALAKKMAYSKMHMVTTAIEHSSVIESFKKLESLGVSVDYILPDEKGEVSAETVLKKLRPNTVLVSVHYANNEIGIIEPIHKISKILKSEKSKTKPVFHVDACQAPLYLDVNKETLGADIISFDGHKIYGPKGIGCLYISSRFHLTPIIFGGGQEKSLRPGTENVPLIAGLAKSFALAAARRKKDEIKVGDLKKYFLERIRKNIPEAVINSTLDNGLPNVVNVSLPGIDADLAVIRLSAKGIYCSSKSACRGGQTGSYVIAALGKELYKKSSLRFSFSRYTKKTELDYVIRILVDLYQTGFLNSA